MTIYTCIMYWQDGIHEVPKQFVDIDLDEVKKECVYIANHMAPEGVINITVRIFEMLKEGNKLVADLSLTRNETGADDEKNPKEIPTKE